MIISLSQRSKSKVISILFSCFLTLTCGLFLYSANTPLGPCYSSDNAIYMIMGTALSHGFRPYLDIFDHKGPFLFLLQLLPQSFGDGYLTITIFFQELLFLFLCLRIICRISHDIFHFQEIMPQLIYLSFISSLVGEGNLSEEYSNLFSLLAFYFSIRFIYSSESSEDRKKYILTTFIIGICFTLCFLTRANNALPIAFFCVGIFLYFLFKKKIRAIIYCCTGFFLGCLLAALPICLWLIHNGALKASIQASIFHNLQYSKTTSEYTTGRISTLLYSPYGHAALLFFSICIIASILFLYNKRKQFSLFFGIILSASGALIAAFISHKYYDHYLILGVPMAVICCIYLLSLIPAKKKAALIFIILIPCSIWLITQCHLANVRRKASNINLEQFIEDASFLSSKIPQNERDSVYPYRVEPKWYVAAKILPCNRYYFLQETLADAEPAIMDEIVSFFEVTPPIWLVIYKEGRAFSPPYDPRIQKIFSTYYEYIDSAGEYQLLHLNKTTE